MLRETTPPKRTFVSGHADPRTVVIRPGLYSLGDMEAYRKDIDRVVGEYNRAVKSKWRGGGDARANVANLVGHGVAADVLLACARHYAQDCEMSGKEAGERKGAAKFYEAHEWQGWVDPPEDRGPDTGGQDAVSSRIDALFREKARKEAEGKEGGS